MVERLARIMRDKLLGGHAGSPLARSLKKPKAWSRETPTTTIYFADVMSDLVSNSLLSDAPLIRLEPNVFATRGPRPVTVVVRYASHKMLQRLSSTSGSRVFYVIDDDVSEVEHDQFLPADYRGRMIEFRNNTVAPLSVLADEILAPSQVILDTFDHKPGTLIAPAAVHGFSDLEHHLRGDGLFEIVFGGTRSHVEDLAALAPNLHALLCARPDIRLTTFLGKHAPDGLTGNNIRHLDPMSWPDYRDFVSRNRFHLSILPALDTRFNRARSQSRILDNAAFGAAAIYPARAPFANWVNHGENAVLAGDDPAQWCDLISKMADNRALTKAIAANGIALARAIGDRDAAREFWLDKLGISDVRQYGKDNVRRA